MSQTRRHESRRPPTTKAVTPAVHDTELVDSMSDFLDEVDAVLEENALEVVRTYRQRSGQ